MVLILSTKTDLSTSKVILWLNHLKIPFIRINEDQLITIRKLSYQDFVFKFKDKFFKFSEFRSVWYRRGDFNIHFYPSLESKETFLNQYNIKEGKDLNTYIHNLIKEKKSINNFNTSTVNKLDVLHYCKIFDLNKTNFIVTQSKKEFLNFYRSNNKEVISKAINNPYIMVTADSNFTSFTHKVSEEEIKYLPNSFPPTFFQGQIEKKYEIRTFYLEGNFFSMAIFSQSNEKTAVDFRHYDWQKPNRLTPFLLPNWYKEKLEKMLQNFNINCASLDTIISKNDEFVMLDINPIGQFGMVSTPCNYNLERLIAEHLR